MQINSLCNFSALVLLLLFSISCRSIDKDLQASRQYKEKINWPPEYKPEESSFFIHNSIRIKASPEAVWSILIQAESWPQWYEGAENVKLQKGHRVLQADSVFTWSTMGLDFTSTIKEFVPNRRLSWESKKTVIRGYHAWLIIPTEGGSILITDEAQHGFLTHLQKVFVPNKLHRLHDIWLAKIKEKAEAAETLAQAGRS